MGILNAFMRDVYMPMCRGYAKRIVKDKEADRVLVFLASVYFFKMHGYWPQLSAPQTFEEKINYRMLFQRDPLWTQLSDKLRVREYVADRVASEYLIPLLWVGDDPADIPFPELPGRFVLKANHGCGYNIVVTEKSEFDQDRAIAQLRRWLHENFGADVFLGTQWAYRNIQPRPFVEQFVGDEARSPVDYKFFCYSGSAEFVQVNIDRFGDATEKFFDRSFRPLDLWQGTRQHPTEVGRPSNYGEMIEVAEALASGLDFIRVDMYSIDDRVYVGELTVYPSAGATPFVPIEYDYLFGSKWRLSTSSRTPAEDTSGVRSSGV